MQFASSGFILIFLPAAIGIYYLVKLISKNNIIAKNISLLVLSLTFYFFGSGLYNFLIILGYIGITYLFGILIDKLDYKSDVIKDLCFYLFLTITVGFLISFKALNVSSLKIALPLAVSFISFQSIAYLIDVRKWKIKTEYNPINFYMYCLLFTKLVSGPIMNYSSIKECIYKRKETSDKFFEGIIRFAFGLAKKVFIAGFIYPLQNFIFSADPNNLSLGVAWLGLLCYTLFLYYDFSSYSDMAIGLSKIFGFEICENFDYPYTSFSLSEFWRKWHMSLSLWFKEYIYFPLGGSRKGKVRTLINVAIIFLLTGVWHGFTLPFLLWGIYFAVFMVIEKAFLYKTLEKNKFKPLNVVYVLFFVSMSWVLFASKSLDYALKYYGVLFGIIKSSLAMPIPLTYKTLIGIILGILFVGYIQRPLKPLLEKYKSNSVWQITTFAISICLIGLSIFFIVTGTYSPSVYGGL